MVRTAAAFFLFVSISIITVPFAAESDEPPVDAQSLETRVDSANSQDAQQDDDRIILPSQDPEAIARRDFMRTKLMYTQNIFQGLISHDFEIIEESIREVQMITEGERWVALDNENYRRLTLEFQRSAARLLAAAETGNINATALRYYDLSTRCIDCHRHLESAREGL